MTKSTIQIRIQTSVKNEAELILSNSGLSLSEAIRSYLSQIVMQNGIPYKGFISTQKNKKDEKTVTAANDNIDPAKARRKLLESLTTFK